jgi:hypothetical protein
MSRITPILDKASEPVAQGGLGLSPQDRKTIVGWLEDMQLVGKFVETANRLQDLAKLVA